jgi:sugar phosphate isomerase/epimerase
MISRRHWLGSALAAVGSSSLSAIEPIARPGQSRMQLGLAAYSFREFFQWSRDKQNAPREGHKPWSMIDFIDWCADHHVPGAELTSYFFPPQVSREFLLEVRRRAYLRGVQISGTAVGNNFAMAKGEAWRREIDYVKQWIEHAALMGAPHIRVFAGPKPKALSLEQAMANCQEAYQECLDHAAKFGVFLGLENHGGIVEKPDELVALVRSAKSPWAGINLDSGNFHTADPYGDLAKIAPYAVNVQLKMEMRPEGSKQPQAADVPRLLKLLREANYQGWFTLEYEVKADPFAEVPKILDMLRQLLA